MTLAYLVNTYPRASHSFIRREILALEQQGWQVHRFAMRSDRHALVDTADLAEDTRTEHVLKAPKVSFLARSLGWMLRHPGQALHAFRLALACGGRGSGGGAGTGGRLRHLVYLLEAAYIARRCADLGIQHIHAHFGTNSTTVAMLAEALGGPGYSFTTHGPEEFDAPHALSLAEKLRRARFSVAISSFGRSQLCRWIDPALWERVKVVHCGIEPEKFPDPAPLPKAGPHLVAIGRLAPQKGFALLIEALALAKLPDLRLVLVGDGELRDSLTAAVAHHELTEQVRFAGWQNEAGVRDALAQSQVLVLPSFAEGLPVVVMEAMAAGRPILATAIAGVPELVTPDCGWLVPAGDAAGLSEAIQLLAATPSETLTLMGGAARSRVLDRHDVAVEGKKLSALFTAAMKGQP